MRHVVLGLWCVLAAMGWWSAEAKIIGRDDRNSAQNVDCRDLGFTVARLLVQTAEGEIRLSTATAFQIGESDTFFISTAHSLYKGGSLKAALDDVAVEVLLPNPTGGCRFRSARISRFAVGSVKPRQTFFGAARDILVFEIESEGFDTNSVQPVRYTPGRECTRLSAELISFAWDYQEGLTPYKASCKLRDKSAESEYPDTSFQHHDCDTTTGSSGSLLFCGSGQRSRIPHAIHAVGWGKNGRAYGNGAYNVAVPLDPEMLRSLYRAMKIFGD